MGGGGTGHAHAARIECATRCVADWVPLLPAHDKALCVANVLRRGAVPRQPAQGLLHRGSAVTGLPLAPLCGQYVCTAALVICRKPLVYPFVLRRFPAPFGGADDGLD